MQNTWLLLRGPYEVFLAHLQAALAQAGFADVYPTHTGCIFAHLPADGARLTELALRAGLRKQTIGYFVDYLAAHGYVERVPDPADQRAKLIRLTERGREADRVAREAIGRIEESWSEWLGHEQMATLHALLMRLNEILVAADSNQTERSASAQPGGRPTR